MPRLLLIVILLLRISLDSFGEFRGPDFNFIHINTDNGLPSDRVRDIAEDSDGFIWFATDGGLVRYEGTRVKIFNPKIPTREEEEVFVMNVTPYREGLLVGTDHGLYGYDPRREKLEMLPLKYKAGIKKIEGTVLGVSVDQDDFIWVTVEGEGVFKISSQGEVTYQYHFPEIKDYISKTYIDDDNVVWAISNNQEGLLYRYDRRDSQFKPFALTIDGNKTYFGGSVITCDENGDYWIGTWDRGLVKFNDRTGEAESYCHDLSYPAWHIHSITPYNSRMLLVGSDSGLMLLDTVSGDYCFYENDELNQESMSGRFVYPITRDSKGGIWIGTFYKGVNYLGKGSARFSKWNHSRFKNSVGGNVISRLCEDNDGNVWIGSADGGLCKLDPKSRQFTHFPISVLKETDNINALAIDGNKLWVGTYSKGAGYLDMETGKWKSVPVENEENSSSYAICRDSSGRIWMGATQTLVLYNEKKQIFERISDLKAWINDIDEDNNGELWISTQGAGLFRYNPETKKWKNYNTSVRGSGVTHNHINCIKVLNGDQIYMGNPKGLSRYDKNDDKFITIPGFPSNVSANSIEDSGDELWVSTNKGLICLKSDGQSKTYTSSDGLCDNQFLPGSSLHASDGTLYYGSVYGFSGVNPYEVRSKASTPNLKFTALNIINNPVEVGDPHLPTSLNDIKELVLDNSDHTFTIFFTALSYDNPKNNEYKYRLEGFDKTWHDAANDNGATYSNLPPGTYTLRVKGANSDGVWNEDGISLKIVVKPVWYMTTLMKLLYLVLIIAFLLFVVRYVLWRMEQSHARELDRISDNKEKEMFRSKLSFFTVVAHEIRTPVSLIIGPLEKVLSSDENFSKAVKEDLHVIDRNAKRLLSLVNQLLDYKKVEDNALPLGFRHQNIIPHLESILSRFRPSFEHKGIKLSVDFPEHDLEVDVDPEAITKLFSNLLNNAMKFTRDSIKVECKRVSDSDKFLISVADNGIGISKENQDKVFKPFFQVLDNLNEAKGGTGLGLSIVSSVVNAHGGEIKLKSEPGQGSVFTVILPIHQKDIVPFVENDRLSEESPLDSISPSDDEDNAPEQDPVLLVVDDNEEMVNFITSHFEKRFEVVSAGNGVEALEKMKEYPISLIICDWMMPVMDGEEFLRKIRNDENYSHIPFVMLTAKTDNTSKITTMKSGADAYVEKPFSINYLDARIDNLLEMRALLRKKYSKEPFEPITTIAQTQVDNDLLTKLQALIEENFSNPELNVDFLADHLGISRSGLYAKIRTLADVTPNELIQITRLKKAAELLAENKYRISEICYMVGFNSSSYFSRCFQKQFGMKPGDFLGKKK